MPETRPSSPRKDREEEKRRQEENRRQVRFSISYLLSSLLALWLFQVFVLTPLGTRSAEISYSDFKKKLANAQIVEVTIGERSIKGEMKNLKPDGSSAAVPFNTVFVFAGDPKLTEELQNANVSYRFERPPSPWLAFC